MKKGLGVVSRRAVSQDLRPPPGEGDDRLEESLKRGEKREQTSHEAVPTGNGTRGLIRLAWKAA